jgi:exonuclease III
MKGCFWNSDGFRDIAKHRFVRETISEHKLDFFAILETGRDNFSTPFLNNISGGQDFQWYCLPPIGRSGGILFGINTTSLSVQKVVAGNRCVKLFVKTKSDQFCWALVAVYGAAQDEHKPEFLAELVRICEEENLPILVGGDFNIIRRKEEKNNDNFNSRWPFMFNAIIESLDLREIVLSGRQYTWANRRNTPTYEKLDRVLASVSWEQKFPLVSVQALPRSGSDHTPLLVDSGDQVYNGNKTHFSFELAWLKLDGFAEMVTKEWSTFSAGSTPMEIWQNKIRHLRQFLRGWAKNLSGTYKVEKEKLLSIIDTLDCKAETTPLDMEERRALREAQDAIAKLRRTEESKWAQRAKVKYIQEGGENTKYFHLIANGKHRRKKIFQLEQDEGTIVGQENLKNYITEYYKGLFGAPEKNNCVMDESMTQDIPQISMEENDILSAPFNEKEIFEAISNMEKNKAPGPDGFPAEFYQYFWEVIKYDLLALFTSFQIGSLPLFHLNFGTIILLPKKENAMQIQQYRPICLLNVCFKIFTKVGTNRITGIAESVVQPTQTAFMPGRYILEGVVILHETIHELHRKKLDGVLFKIDFEKAYDKVNWDFLQQAMRLKGFNPVWCNWIQQFIEKGSVGIRVNDDIGRYFQTKKGLRQGDPLSPILFNIVADMLAIMIQRAKADDQISGLIPHLVEGGISILQYADDTILFMDNDLDKALNMKLILCLFEQLSGLKINFHKSEIFCFGRAMEREADYKNLFGCNSGSLPFRYLGIPIHFTRLRNGDWKPVEDRFESKLSCWAGKMLSYGDRLTLINSVLTSMPMFMLSFFRVPAGVRKRLDYFRSRFFWQGDGHKKKYRLTKWNIICRPKDQGGLGIEDLDLKNICLLSKWLFKLMNEEGVWQELLNNKYVKDKTLSQVSAKPTDSHFWKGLMGVKDLFFERGSSIIGNGQNTRFWEDTWLGDKPLCDQYPSLYRIVNYRNVSVSHVMLGAPLNIGFRRALLGDRWDRWVHLVSRLMQIRLSEEEDVFHWNLTASGIFTVRSMYNDMLDDFNGDVKKYIWKIKVPLKIRIFMWFLYKQVILTKDNLIKRNWQGSPKCCFCDQDETIQHLFLSCPFVKLIWRILAISFNFSTPTTIANLFGNWLNGVTKKLKGLIRVGVCALVWAIWTVRNDCIFNQKSFPSFLQVIPIATHWIHMWSFLQPEDVRQDMDTGCNRLAMVAREFYSRFGWRSDRRLT